eukprot:CAMPEP_0198209958 /NCGR_PEP_ID=MMETSP1445-20131203/17835_1 /TAXON_ID=36898 /ORGANISM="Pyramimonas sp., Strain CCMP2087" /LENGTH=140 /DNA_ID=CAMNT_0043883875 /DNA_START=446 /DNA_END=865 /DNA_ORIENTATION=+
MTVTIVSKFAGLVTNFEVRAVLLGRGADPQVPPDPPRTREAANCEVKVLEALQKSPAALQTREMISAFSEAIEVFGLTKGEKLQLVNEVPSTLVHIHVIVEDCEERFSGEQLDTLLELIETHLGSSRLDQGEKGGSEDDE